MADYLEPELGPDDPDDLPLPPDLHPLAAFGEHHVAVPLSPAAVRRLGTSRRRRRHTGIAAGALALVVLAGGVAFGTTGQLLGDDPPPVVGTPALPSPTPVRSVGSDNLITVGQIRSLALNTTTKAVDADNDSPVMACGNTALFDELGATSWASRTFRAIYADTGDPNVCTVVLQFGSADAARTAREEYQRQFDDRSLWSGGTALARLGFDWTEIALDGPGSATVAEYVYRPDGMAEVDGAVWESHALTQVGDRLALTVYQNIGPEWYAELDVSPPNDGAFPHPQLKLTRAAEKRLQD